MAQQESGQAEQADRGDEGDGVTYVPEGGLFRPPAAIGNVYAVGEHKGSLSIFAAVFPAADMAAWAAASRGPAIQDEWPVSPINLHKETQVTAGYRQLVGEDATVRKFPSDHDQLNWLINLYELGPTGPRLPW